MSLSLVSGIKSIDKDQALPEGAGGFFISRQDKVDYFAEKTKI